MPVEISLEVNGTCRPVLVEPRTTLIDCLRDSLPLTGAKRPCDMGNCGACTVLLDGEAVYSCLVLAVECEGHAITTIESEDESLETIRAAFVECDALQCGYCTPGQILAMASLFAECSAPTDGQLIHAMSGNLCRCGAYPNILEAGRRVRAEIGGTRDRR